MTMVGRAFPGSTPGVLEVGLANRGWIGVELLPARISALACCKIDDCLRALSMDGKVELSIDETERR